MKEFDHWLSLFQSGGAILIRGKAKSGKSTFSSYLMKQCRDVLDKHVVCMELPSSYQSDELIKSIHDMKNDGHVLILITEDDAMPQISMLCNGRVECYVNHGKYEKLLYHTTPFIYTI